jgi:hypothetical protein
MKSMSMEYIEVKKYMLNNFTEEDPLLIDKSLLQFFRTIQAPDSLRGIQNVLLAILEIHKHMNARFYIYFGIRHKHLVVLTAVIDELVVAEQYDFANKVLGKGWCNKRPLYTLFFYYQTYGKSQSGVNAHWLAIFLDHYFSKNKQVTQLRGYRVVPSCSAMRLLLSIQDPKEFTPVEYCRESSVEDIAQTLMDNSKREWLANKTVSYMRLLSHFFALDWGRKHNRENRRVARHGDTRGNHTKLEPIIGAGTGLLAEIPKVTNDAAYKGLTLEDCFSDILSIQSEPEVQQRPAYELPMLTPVRDKSLRAVKSKNISQKVRASHNISLMDKNLLQPYELLILFGQLQKLARPGRKEIKGVPAITIALTCWCMLLTGKSLDDTLAFNISRSKEKNGVWRNANFEFYWQFEIVRAVKSYDKTLSDYCRISLPTFLIPIVNAVHESFHGSKGYHYLIPERYNKTIKNAVETWLSKLSDSTGIRVGENKLSSYIAHRLLAMEETDPIIFDFAFSNRTYLSRVTRHYSRVKTKEIADELSQFWKDVENDIRKVDYTFQLPKDFCVYRAAEDEDVVGSVFTPSKVQVRQMVNEIKSPLALCAPKVLLVRKRLSALVDYHNQYVTYLAYMVLYATGYRAVYNPLPILALVLPRYSALVISDKDDSDFTHTRLVPLPSVLATQIDNYRNHLSALRAYLAAFNPEIVSKIMGFLDEQNHCYFSRVGDNQKWYKEVKNSRKNLGPLFYLSIGKTGLRASIVSPSWLSGRVGNSSPINAGRHFIRSELLRRGISSELINFQMGHWSVGQAPLGDYSCFEFAEAIEELLPELAKILEDCEWKAVVSAIA